MKQLNAGYAEQPPCRTPAPASVICKGCNHEFFARSLPIHQKTCFQKNAFVDIVCAKCSSAIRSGRFHAHEQSCAGVKPQAPLGDLHQATPHTTTESKQGTQDEELNQPDADGRVRCRKCDRAFNQDRIAKHQSVCRDRPRAGTQKERYDPAKEAKRGAPSPTHLRRRRAQTESTAKSKPRADNQTSKVLNVSFQHQHQQQQQKPKPQACMSRSYDFGNHFSSEDMMDNVRERDKKRFDIVLRDAPQRQQSMGSTPQSTRFASSTSSGLSAKSLSLLASNVTSSANPLATNRFMTSISTSIR